MNEYNIITDSVKKDGTIRLRDGVYVCSSEYLTEEQKEWENEDNSKNLDFSEHGFWLMTDNGYIAPFSKSDLD